MRNWLHRGFKFLPWLLLALVAIYFAFFDGWRDATSGRFHRKAFELFSNTHKVTKAEVYLLMGEESAQEETTFPIRPDGSTHPVYGSTELSGKELDEFLKVWRYQEPSIWRQALCHHPAYGFRLYEGGSLVAETSICWECSNYYVTAYPGMSGWYGFIADSENAKALLDFCDARLPYKRPSNAQEATRAEQDADDQLPSRAHSKAE